MIVRKNMLLNTLAYLEFFFEIESLELKYIYKSAHDVSPTYFCMNGESLGIVYKILCTCYMKMTGISMNKLLLHLLSAKE